MNGAAMNRAAMNGTASSTLPRAELVEANEQAARFYREQLLHGSADGPRSYLQARGFQALLQETLWTIGYAPARWTPTRDHLLKQGFSPEVLLAAGLVSTTRTGGTIDRFRDRLTFGIRDLDGNLVGFTARCAPGASASVPKYLNTPRTALYDKGSILFGLGEQAHHLRDGFNLVLVEGPLDALAVDLVNSAGSTRFAPLAACGTAITLTHGAVIAGLVQGHVIVALDRDPAGMKATEAAYDALRGQSASLFTASLPRRSDPAQTLTVAGTSGLQRHLTQLRPLADAIVDDRIAARPNLDGNAEARVACLRQVTRVVARMTPEDATHQAARLSSILGLDQETVTRELTDAVTATSTNRGSPPMAPAPAYGTSARGIAPSQQPETGRRQP
jgi:DNA primase